MQIQTSTVVPTYSEGPRTLLSDATAGGGPLQITDRASRFLTIYTDQTR